MTFRLRPTLIFLFLLIGLMGCSQRPNANLNDLEKRSLNLDNVSDINKSLLLQVRSTKQYFSWDSEIPIIIENQAARVISLDLGTSIRLFISANNKWLEVKNGITYPDQLMLAPKEDTVMNFHRTRVQPLLEQSSLAENNTSVVLRIVVIGEFLSGGTPQGSKVGAYADVLLKEERVKSTDEMIVSTQEITTSNTGKVNGTITSADNIDQPMAGVEISLEPHPKFHDTNLSNVFDTKTDSQGMYSFENVAPGTYSVHTRFISESGDVCDKFDLTKVIKVKVGSIVTLNFSLSCT